MRAKSTLIGALLVTPLAACQPTDAQLPLDEARAAAIRDSVTAALAEFRTLSNAAEWDRVLPFYSASPDFRFFENGELQYRSAEDVRSALASLPPGMRIETTYSEVEVLPVRPGLATVSATFESTATVSGGGFSYGGMVTMLWGHESGGWRILSGHSSAPVPRGGDF